MSKISIRRKGRKILILCLPAAVTLGGGYTIYRSLGEEQETAVLRRGKQITRRILY